MDGTRTGVPERSTRKQIQQRYTKETVTVYENHAQKITHNQQRCCTLEQPDHSLFIAVMKRMDEMMMTHLPHHGQLSSAFSMNHLECQILKCPRDPRCREDVEPHHPVTTSQESI